VGLWIYCASFSRKTRDFPGQDWLKPKYLNASIQFTSKLSIYFVTEFQILSALKPDSPGCCEAPKWLHSFVTVAEHPSISAFHRGALQFQRIINYLSVYLSANGWRSLFHHLFAGEFSSDYTSFGCNIWIELSV